MPVLVQCPSCKARIRLPEAAGDRLVRCPQCTAKFQPDKVDGDMEPSSSEAFTRESPPSARKGGEVESPRRPDPDDAGDDERPLPRRRRRHDVDGHEGPTAGTRRPRRRQPRRTPIWLWLTIPGVIVILVVVLLVLNSDSSPKTPPAATQFQGLVAYWPFEDDNPAALVADVSKNGNDAKAFGATRVDGIRGKALAFDKDAFFDYGSHPSLNFPGPFTFACWVKTQSASGMLISQRHSRDDGADIDLFLAGGRLKAHVRRDKGFFAVLIEGNVQVNDDRWRHCALVRSEKSAQLFVDGAPVGSNWGNEAEGPITTDMRSLCLERRWQMQGKHDHLGVPMSLTAAVDELYIFNRALAPEEIRALAGR